MADRYGYNSWRSGLCTGRRVRRQASAKNTRQMADALRLQAWPSGLKKTGARLCVRWLGTRSEQMVCQQHCTRLSSRIGVGSGRYGNLGAADRGWIVASCDAAGRVGRTRAAIMARYRWPRLSDAVTDFTLPSASTFFDGARSHLITIKYADQLYRAYPKVAPSTPQRFRPSGWSAAPRRTALRGRVCRSARRSGVGVRDRHRKPPRACVMTTLTRAIYPKTTSSDSRRQGRGSIGACPRSGPGWDGEAWR